MLDQQLIGEPQRLARTKQALMNVGFMIDMLPNRANFLEGLSFVRYVDITDRPNWTTPERRLIPPEVTMEKSTIQVRRIDIFNCAPDNCMRHTSVQLDYPAAPVKRWNGVVLRDGNQPSACSAQSRTPPAVVDEMHATRISGLFTLFCISFRYSYEPYGGKPRLNLVEIIDCPHDRHDYFDICRSG
jgi:hypothetical protein